MSDRTKRIIYTTEGRVIKKLREENNLTMKELGKHIGLSDSSISSWENGHGDPTKENIAKICAHFKIGEKYFYELCREYQKNESPQDFIENNAKKLDQTSAKMLRAMMETMLANKK